jgi:hypothetical protein
VSLQYIWITASGFWCRFGAFGLQLPVSGVVFSAFGLQLYVSLVVSRRLDYIQLWGSDAISVRLCFWCRFNAFGL